MTARAPASTVATVATPRYRVVYRLGDALTGEAASNLHVEKLIEKLTETGEKQDVEPKHGAKKQSEQFSAEPSKR